MNIIAFLEPGFCNVILRFAICFLVNWIIVDKLYYKRVIAATSISHS